MDLMGVRPYILETADDWEYAGLEDDDLGDQDEGREHHARVVLGGDAVFFP